VSWIPPNCPDHAAGPRRAAAASIALAAALALAGCGNGEAGADVDEPLFTVQRGPLTINLIEAGTVRAGEVEEIKCEVPDRPYIKSIIDEGTMVEPGAVLMEIDATTFEDEKIDQENDLNNARAAFVTAREKLEITRKQGDANVQDATVQLELAQLDLKKYLEGEYKQSLDEAQSKIALAEAEAKQAAEKYEWSKRLYDEEYLTSIELQADELAKKKAELDLDLARGALKLLTDYTHARKLAELQNAVAQKKFALEKAEHEKASNLAEAETNLAVKESNFKREELKLERIVDVIDKCTIRAPIGGRVIYATSVSRRRHDDDEALEVGRQVYMRQDLFRIPIAQEMVADVKVHESKVQRVKVGQPVVIAVDAIAGKTFTGRIKDIAPQPDQPSWWNPDLKVFNAEISIECAPGELKSGMSCQAEVIVAHYEDTLYVPVQSVLMVDGKPTVHVWRGKDREPQRRPIEIGLDNSRMVRVVSGVEVGEQVMLTPPLPPATKVNRFRNGPPEAPDAEAPVADARQPRSRDADEPGSAEDRGDSQSNADTPRRPRFAEGEGRPSSRRDGASPGPARSNADDAERRQPTGAERPADTARQRGAATADNAESAS